jgi:integrase
MAERLTDKLVRSLKPPPLKAGKARNVITFDASQPGFGARITSAGAISFVLNYRILGRERRITLGRWPAWSVSAARQRAAELRRAVDAGRDPLSELAAERGAPTVAELCGRFEAEHLPKLAPATQIMYRAILKNEIVPVLGSAKVAAIEYADIDRLHSKISRRAPYMANRTLALVSKMFALAILWGMRKDSPVCGVQRNREDRRTRYLSPDELVRLTRALSEHHNRPAADALMLMLLTGARSHEVLSAEWTQVDLGAGVWTKLPGTTKQRRVHRVPLSGPALAVLARIRDRGEDAKFVFPGPGPRGYRTRLKRDWALVCKAAGISGLRIHDLRHSYAAALASSGIGLHVIGGLLGHNSPTTTHRYAHLLDDPLRAATERAAAIITGQPAAEVVPMKRGRR